MKTTLAFLISLAVLAAPARSDAPTPAALEQAYRENNLGVAMMEQFQHAEAAEAFRRALALAPDLAVAKLNLAIALFNIPDLEGAAKAVEVAAAALPNAPQPEYLRGLIARQQNRMPVAEAAFRRVLKMDPRDVGSNVIVGQLLMQERKYEDAMALFRAALDSEPYNVTATYNLAMANMRTGRTDEGQRLMKRFQSLRESGRGTALGNTYPDQGRYAEGLTSTGAEPDLVDPKTPPVRLRPAAYAPQPIPGGVVALLDLDQDEDLDVAVAGDSGLTLLRNEGGRLERIDAGVEVPAAAPIPPVAGDYDNDGKTDLFAAGRLLHNEGGSLTDVTGAAGIAYPFVSRAVAWVDVDHDGDLDLFITGFAEKAGSAAPAAPNRLYRNDGNGHFTDVTEEARLAGGERRAVAVVPTDFDNRRDVDLLVVNDGGGVQLFRNMREGFFEDVAAEVGLPVEGAFACAAAGDINKDGYTDFFLGQPDGPGLLAKSDGRSRFALSPAPPGAGPARASAFLDYDNDGLLDLVTITDKGLRILRQVGGGEWRDVSATATDGLDGDLAAPFAAADLDGNGSLDLVFSDARVLMSEGEEHGSLRVRLSARVSNAGGVGAKVEVLAGSLRQKIEAMAATPAPAPVEVQIGLGSRQTVDAVRVLWPAGIVQAETEVGTGAEPTLARVVSVKELDRKPSSCPYLYAWNGTRFEFITDFLGAGEMGYWEGPGHHSQPESDEYVLMRGDQLRARDGRYELRVTNELEEVLYLDKVQLLAVDHPQGTEVHPAEGMTAAPGRAFRLFVVKNTRTPRIVRDDAGQDVRDALTARDRRYVDTFTLHRIRGYAEPHALVLDLDPLPAAPVLLLNGWTDYAFSSDNVAAHQSGLELEFPVLEVQDADGAWRTLEVELGVPVGRPQTIALDLAGKLPPGAHVIRLRTNMRIYWDEVRVGEGVAATTARISRIDPSSAELAWRGYSAETTPDGHEPYGYDFERVSFLSPWKVMPGRYTREGDVLPLLTSVDDMYVVSRPGDAIALRFDAAGAPPPPDGWERSFLLYADGFSKEMDINSASPDVVAPLPFHGMTEYPYGEGEAFPESEAHRKYLSEYNTRLVTRPIQSLEAVAARAREEQAAERR